MWCKFCVWTKLTCAPGYWNVTGDNKFDVLLGTLAVAAVAAAARHVLCRPVLPCV